MTTFTAETSVWAYDTTPWHNPEGHNLSDNIALQVNAIFTQEHA
jgi:hypothetical protein